MTHLNFSPPRMWWSWSYWDREWHNTWKVPQLQHHSQWWNLYRKFSKPQVSSHPMYISNVLHVPAMSLHLPDLFLLPSLSSSSRLELSPTHTYHSLISRHSPQLSSLVVREVLLKLQATIAVVEDCEQGYTSLHYNLVKNSQGYTYLPPQSPSWHHGTTSHSQSGDTAVHSCPLWTLWPVWRDPGHDTLSHTSHTTGPLSVSLPSWLSSVLEWVYELHWPARDVCSRWHKEGMDLIHQVIRYRIEQQ